MADSLNLFLTCPKGVEDLLQAECAAHGLEDARAVIAGVQARATLQQAYRLCLWSRVASRVLLELGTFPVAGEADPYDGIRAMDWSPHLDARGSFAVDLKAPQAVVANTHFAALRVKDAIVDQFRERSGSRPGIDRDRPDIRVHVYIGRELASVYLDLSGTPLHQRGYRQGAGAAPLKENLAAAILLRSRWPDLAGQGRPLLDPMCGAGTLLIEAAMMATNTAPGLRRPYFGFNGWKQHDEVQWRALLSEAEGLRRETPGCRITGIEKSYKVTGIARQNARAAGFGDAIEILQADSLSAYSPGDAPGLLVTNPPYGKRLGVSAELKQLYLDLGQSVRAELPGWDISLFTAEHELARFFGLRAHRRNVLYNGAIRCTLYQYRLKASPPPETGGASDEERAMFANRLRKNHRHLSKWAKREGLGCYRVYDADIPQYAAAIDVYDGWVRVQEYAAPRTVNNVKAFIRLKDIVATVAEVLEVPPDRVIVKQRQRQSGTQQYNREGDSGATRVVTEYGLKFRVNLHDYLDTGLFVDHRITRRMIRENARGKSFLNLFAYTGVATVYAAAGGASGTTTVDLSNTYLDWARDNMALNGFRGDQHRFIRADCLQWLDEAGAAGGDRYDLVFLDPPTFSNSKRMEETLDIRRDHPALILKTLALLEQGGVLVFSCNARGFRLETQALAGFHVRDMTRATTSEDFRRKPQHKCWLIGRNEERLKTF